jgi:hypothetical protein
MNNNIRLTNCPQQKRRLTFRFVFLIQLVLSHVGQHPHKASLLHGSDRKLTLNCLWHYYSDYCTSISLCNNYKHFSPLPALYYTLSFFRYPGCITTVLIAKASRRSDKSKAWHCFFQQFLESVRRRLRWRSRQSICAQTVEKLIFKFYM